MTAVEDILNPKIWHKQDSSVYDRWSFWSIQGLFPQG